MVVSAAALLTCCSLLYQLNDRDIGQRRGCNCKKSGCLKLYCECFAAGGRCSERCQCISCRNQEHNQEEIAQAIQTIEKRTQKSFRPSLSTPRPSKSDTTATPSRPSSVVSTDTPTTFPTERKTAMAMAGTSPRPICDCIDGNCASDCPCLTLFGTCSTRCQCRGCQIQTKPERTKGCSCKKSNCLKLYCECLAAQRMCDHRCNCEGCKNCPEMLDERERAVAAILERNPLAFQPKVASGSSQHLRGCNCRKSGCMKNYCECHQAGVACTSRCACHQCRNTETFVSAKKMLVFASANTDDNSLRFTIPSQRKLAKRPSRSKKSDLQNGMRTPTNQPTQNPSALELLSRSAPVASSKRYARNDSAVDDFPPTTPTKRPSSQLEHFHSAGGQVTPTFAKRKYTRRSSNKLPFEERIQEASPPEGDLPSVDDTVTNAYDARNTEGVGDPELTLLSRSLLQTAMTVELTEEEEQITPAAADHSPAKQQTEHGSEALSPTSAGLFCEEEYSEAVADDDSHLANEDGIATTAGNEHDSSGQNNGKESLSAMQERAVLQEFSVWLRNLVSGVSPY